MDDNGLFVIVTLVGALVALAAVAYIVYSVVA